MFKIKKQKTTTTVKNILFGYDHKLFNLNNILFVNK